MPDTNPPARRANVKQEFDEVRSLVALDQPPAAFDVPSDAALSMRCLTRLFAERFAPCENACENRESARTLIR